MKSLILISDVHGCHYTLMRLLAKCPKDHQLVLLGDLIDRGPHSKEVVEFAMKNKVPTVAGNHEDMMLAHAGLVDGYDKGIWLQNGGREALHSFGGYLPQDVLHWMNNLPLRLEFSDLPHWDLLLSHTGHGTPLNRRYSLWNRSKEFPDDGKFRVFGHTPEKRPFITKNYAMIDTGAAYGNYGLGTMTAMLWPSKEIIQQEFDETPFFSAAPIKMLLTDIA